MKNLKANIIIIFSLFINTSVVITPVMVTALQAKNFLVLFLNLLFIIAFLLIFNFDYFKLKWLINSRVLKYVNIIYLLIAMISIIAGVTLLINNLYYLKTPLTVVTFALMFITMIIAFNKKRNFLNLFFILFAISLLTILLFGLIFPKSLIKLNFTMVNFKIPYLAVYLILLLDLIYYKFYFTTRDFNFSFKKQILTIILTFLVISYFTYKDLKISHLEFNHLYFPNLLKYRVAGCLLDVHLDFIIIIWILLGCIFKCVLYGDLTRIIFKKKKNEKFYITFFFIIFFITNTITNNVNKDNLLLDIMLQISSIVASITIILLGGYYVACRIHQKE